MKAKDWDDLRDQVLSGQVSPSDALRRLFGYPPPARNDCGYLAEGKCPFYELVSGYVKRKEA